MNKEKNTLADLDDLHFRLSCGVGLIGAVHECIEHGAFKSEAYVDALFGAYDYLDDLVKQMKEVIDLEFESNK